MIESLKFIPFYFKYEKCIFLCNLICNVVKKFFLESNFIKKMEQNWELIDIKQNDLIFIQIWVERIWNTVPWFCRWGIPENQCLFFSCSHYNTFHTSWHVHSLSWSWLTGRWSTVCTTSHYNLKFHFLSFIMVLTQKWSIDRLSLDWQCNHFVEVTLVFMGFFF